MKHLFVFVFLFLMVTMTGCEMLGDIFSAGFYTGLFLVFFVIAIIIFIVMKMRRRR